MGKKLRSTHTRTPDFSRNTHSKRLLPNNQGLNDLDEDFEGAMEINNRSARRAEASKQRKIMSRKG
jgi:hypothetical protein